MPQPGGGLSQLKNLWRGLLHYLQAAWHLGGLLTSLRHYMARRSRRTNAQIRRNRRCWRRWRLQNAARFAAFAWCGASAASSPSDIVNMARRYQRRGVYWASAYGAGGRHWMDIKRQKAHRTKIDRHGSGVAAAADRKISRRRSMKTKL